MLGIEERVRVAPKWSVGLGVDRDMYDTDKGKWVKQPILTWTARAIWNPWR